MEPKLVPCDRCGEEAILHSVHYVYQKREVQPDMVEHELKEVVQLIECPNCGHRSQGQVEDVQNSS
jgi:ribosomal protein L32